MSLDQVRIPQERISVLIGKSGENKKLLEKKTKTKIKVDSKEGIVTIEGEALDVYNAKPIVKAVGHGFKPNIAEELLNEENTFEVVSLKDFARSANDLLRIKSRVIGSKGTCKSYIESITKTTIVVYGKTVGIIGKSGNCFAARQAVEKLLQGARHGNVYAWLEKKMREERTKEHP